MVSDQLHFKGSDANFPSKLLFLYLLLHISRHRQSVRTLSNKSILDGF